MPTMLPYSRAAPPRPRDQAAAVRRAARDILIWARIIELRSLARRTAAGEQPGPPDAPAEESARP